MFYYVLSQIHQDIVKSDTFCGEAVPPDQRLMVRTPQQWPLDNPVIHPSATLEQSGLMQFVAPKEA